MRTWLIKIPLIGHWFDLKDHILRDTNRPIEILRKMNPLDVLN